jgi:WXG100 family type VII secretion target
VITLSQRINISPDQVDKVGKQFDQANREVMQIISRLRSTVNKMQGHWEGNRKSVFQEDFQQQLTNLQKYSQNLANTSQQLHNTARKFRQIDQSR